MGNLTLNALAITLVSALALWIFYRSAKIEKKRSDKDRADKEQAEKERKKDDTPKQD